MVNKGTVLDEKGFKDHEKSLKKSITGKKWDGRLRPPTDTYRKRCKEIFEKKENDE